MSLTPRPRRRRSSAALRDMLRETRLAPSDFILPLFVAERPEDARPIGAMPGVVRHSLEGLDAEVQGAAQLGLRGVLLFGVPASKDAAGSGGADPLGIVPRAVRRIKALGLPLVVITDVCLCAYTDHGHCGIIEDGEVVNDATLERLRDVAVCHAEAGADIVAPSAMMDGMVGALRQGLDSAGHSRVAILSYAVKYASAFYGPFREAAASAPAFGDRRSHQMDPANAREARLEARLDVEEGADMLMVKPALPYLDIVRDLRSEHPAVPLFAYQVSGEYSMIRAAGAAGYIDEQAVALESLISIKRAGASAIITYFAKEAALWVRD